MKLKLIVTACIAASVVACSDSTNDSVDNDKFAAFLKVKRVAPNDTAQTEKLKKEFLYRQSLADAITKTDELDQQLIEAEIEEFRKELLISRYFDSYLKRSVSEQGEQNFYNKNIANYQSKKVKVSHILVRTTPRMNETERQAALTTVQDAYGKIKQGIDFTEVAKSMSEDKVSGEKGGDLGWINPGSISAEFSSKAFSMKSGDVSEPFETDYGFHILKVTENAQEVTKPFEAVKGDIRYQLRSKAKNAEIQRLLDTVDYKK